MKRDKGSSMLIMVASFFYMRHNFYKLNAECKNQETDRAKCEFKTTDCKKSWISMKHPSIENQRASHFMVTSIEILKSPSQVHVTCNN